MNPSEHLIRATCEATEFALITRIEELFGRVPNPEQVRAHAEKIHYRDGETIYFWDDVPIVKVTPCKTGANWGLPIIEIIRDR